MTTYAERWGKPRTRTLKGHPKREARRQRANERFWAQGERESREDIARGDVVTFESAADAIEWLKA